MKIYLATDHAGFEFKEKIKAFLQEKGYDVEDCGAFELNPIDDYPDFIVPAAKKVSQNPGSFGIVLGKSGAGECIVANKIKGIRAFLGVNEQNVRLAREHNNANVLSIGSEIVDEPTAKKLVELFLNTPFSNEERHKRRIEKIKQLEQ
ncbi:RpiB/LacA/LacB family sugar-phosphate isomerase [Candidatus Curtissbacteria bacterium]|nr:RpiB/LacA/LacB family sugar-phosphate isomerase [Candidatus Curtissbacteria bacterium]